jgi:hypothetical protein
MRICELPTLEMVSVAFWLPVLGQVRLNPWFSCFDQDVPEPELGDCHSLNLAWGR